MATTVYLNDNLEKLLKQYREKQKKITPIKLSLADCIEIAIKKLIFENNGEKNEM